MAVRVQCLPLSRAEKRKLAAEWERERLAWCKVGRSFKKVAEIHAVVRDHALEPVEDRTPLDEIISAETGKDEGAANRDQRGTGSLRQENFNIFLNWIFGDSPHPAHVLRRLYGMAFEISPRLLERLPNEELKLLLSDSREGVAFCLMKARKRPSWQLVARIKS